MTEGSSKPARLDSALVAARFFESRAKAQEAIAAGLVTVDGKTAHKPAQRIEPDADLQAKAPYPWVSRGGVKLAAGLDLFSIDPAGQVVLDIGASTGGFTDVLLARGASHVYAVDVGRDQLHPRIKADTRVSDWSGTDARNLLAVQFPERPTLVVCDASFISLALVLPAVLPLAAGSASLIALIKPQFEAGRGGTDKGIVRNASVREAACRAIADVIEGLGWTVSGLHPSPILGGDGNVEFLIGAQRG